MRYEYISTILHASLYVDENGGRIDYAIKTFKELICEASSNSYGFCAKFGLMQMCVISKQEET